MQLTITRALTRAKTIKDQLYKLSNSEWVKSIRENDLSSATDFIAKSKSNYDTYKALVEEYLAIHRAIKASNESTMVTVVGITMPVSEVLTYKTFIDERDAVLQSVKRANTIATTNVEKNEGFIEDKAREFVANLNTTEANLEQALELGRSSAIKELRMKKVSGFNVEEFIEKEENFITKFREEVDYVLSESNATTVIEINY